MSAEIKEWYYQYKVKGGWATLWTATPEEYDEGRGYESWRTGVGRSMMSRGGVTRAISDVGLRLEAEERKVQKGGYDGLPR